MLRRAVAAVVGFKPLAALGQVFPPTRALAARFVAGDSLGAALPVIKDLVTDGYRVSVDYLGQPATDSGRADKNCTELLDIMQWLAVERVTGEVEASISLAELGQGLDNGAAISLHNARLLCASASSVGSSVTIGMGDHTETDATFSTWGALVRDYPSTGITLQAALYRTADDVRELATSGQRIRLCKGEYTEPGHLAHTSAREIDIAFVRAMKHLFATDAYPMIATHDVRLIEIARELAARAGREPGTYEFQLFYGMAKSLQERLRDEGERVRLYVPYGKQWYEYFANRLMERPSNVGAIVGSAARRGR